MQIDCLVVLELSSFLNQANGEDKSKEQLMRELEAERLQTFRLKMYVLDIMVVSLLLLILLLSHRELEAMRSAAAPQQSRETSPSRGQTRAPVDTGKAGADSPGGSSVPGKSERPLRLMRTASVPYNMR